MGELVIYREGLLEMMELIKSTFTEFGNKPDAITVTDLKNGRNFEIFSDAKNARSRIINITVMPDGGYYMVAKSSKGTRWNDCTYEPFYVLKFIEKHCFK